MFFPDVPLLKRPERRGIGPIPDDVVVLCLSALPAAVTMMDRLVASSDPDEGG